MHFLAVIGIVGLVACGLGLKFSKPGSDDSLLFTGCFASVIFILLGLFLFPALDRAEARRDAEVRALEDRGCLRYEDPGGRAVATINGTVYEVNVKEPAWYCPQPTVNLGVQK